MITWYVDTDVTAGGDGSSGDPFASLSEVESSFPNPFTDDYTIICTGVADDTTYIQWGVFDEEYTVTIQAADGDEALISGWDDNRYSFVIPDGGHIGIEILNGKAPNFVGLQMRMETSAAYDRLLGLGYYCESETILIDGCRLEVDDTENETNCQLITLSCTGGGGDCVLTIRNSILQQISGTGTGENAINISNSCEVKLQNSILAGFISSATINIASSTGIVTSTNSAFIGGTDDIGGNTGTRTITYTASEETFTGTGNINPTDWDDEFEDYANGDFRLLSTSDLVGAGIAISGLTTDMAGTDYEDPPSIGAFEYVASGTTYQGEASDGIDLGETLANVATFGASAVDGLSMGEAHSNIATMLSTATDCITLSEAQETNVGIFLTATDTLNLTDASGSTATLQAQATDGVTLADALTVAAVLVALASDGVDFGDTSIGEVLGGLICEAIDGFTMADSSSSLAQLLATVLDGVTLSDAASLGGAIEALAADGVVFGDSLESVVKLLVTAIDGLSMSDSSSVTAHFDVTIADGVSFGGTLSSIMTFSATVADTFNLGDVAVHIQASGLVTVSFSCSKATMTFSVKKPSITFTVH